MRDTQDLLKQSILTALDEEKRPKYLRLSKTLIFSSVLTIFFAFGFFSFWPVEFNSVILGTSFFLMLVFIAGFLLYFLPQPRIQVPGLWMTWMWGRLLISMGIISTFQFILCPDLAGMIGIESILPWMSSITHVFMSIGGMKACMFACGILFSGVASGIVLTTMRKVVFRSKWSQLLTAAGFVFLGQLPIIFCQATKSPDYLAYWILGSSLSILFVSLMIRYLGFISLAKAHTRLKAGDL